MLGIALLGSLTAILRAVVLDGQRWWVLWIYAAFLLIPVIIVAVFCAALERRNGAAAWGAGLAAAVTAAVVHFILLDPKYNRDANIGLGLYMLFGWILFLVPAALLGGGLGSVVSRRMEHRKGGP